MTPPRGPMDEAIRELGVALLNSRGGRALVRFYAWLSKRGGRR